VHTRIYASVCVSIETNDSKDMVYLLNIHELRLDRRTGLIILRETWLSVLHSQHLADSIIIFMSICTFFFQFSSLFLNLLQSNQH